jgi:hypothetical protein
MNKGKKAIWLDDFEREVLRGYIAQLIEDDRTPNYAVAIFENVILQIPEEDN